MRFYIALSILCFWNLSLIGQGTGDITNYGPEVYRAGDVVYDVIADNEGILYFSTDRGLLVYDGERWQLIAVADSLSSIRASAYDPRTDRIYVGGAQTFGYFKKDRVHRYTYVDLYNRVKGKYAYSNGWQVVLIHDKVVFQSLEGMYTYANDSISFLPIKQGYLFPIGDRIYISQVKGQLFEWKKDSLVAIWDQKEVQSQGLFDVRVKDVNQHLLVYPYSGIFLRDIKNNTITAYQHPLSDLIKKHYYYAGTMISDSLWVIASWKDGIMLVDLKGNLIKRWTTEDGLINNGTYNMYLGSFGKLWLANEYGISTIDLSPILKNQSLVKPKPHVKVTCVISNYDSIQYTTTVTDTLRFTRKPNQLKINFATPNLAFTLANPYSYQLIGYDTSWTATNGETYAIYKDLHNGTYQFNVKTAVDNVELPTGSVVIIIEEPWYMVFAGIFGYFLLALSSLSLLFFLIYLRQRHARKVLSELVMNKTKEIENQRQKLIQINKSLTDTNEELDTFLYRASHDLISPVKSIKGLINLLRISKDNPNEYINMMDERISRLEGILQEINGYVKNIKREITYEPFDINQLIKETWSELEFMDEADRIDFRLETNSPIEVTSDKSTWKAIISNLISNAIKYHDPDKSSPFIEVSSFYQNGVLTLKISDNGQGIPNKLQGRLFEMFFRAHEVSTGSGLGLFLVKKMVTKLNGDITIQSVQGEGTTVEVVARLSDKSSSMAVAATATA